MPRTGVAGLNLRLTAPGVIINNHCILKFTFPQQGMNIGGSSSVTGGCCSMSRDVGVTAEWTVHRTRRKLP